MYEDSVSREQFSLTFHGDNTIEAALLGRAILDMSQMACEISRIDGMPKKYEPRIKAFPQGSFEVVFEVLLETWETIVPHITIANAAAVLTMIKTVFDIKKHLKERKKQSIEKRNDHLIILFDDGSEIKAPIGGDIIFRNPKVDALASEIGKISLLHNPNEGFSIIDNTGVSQYSPEDVRCIATEQEFVDFSDKEQERTTRVTLPIKAPDLLGNSAWKFKYAKRTISARIDDQSFLDSVHSGKLSYKAGDTLDVSLKTDLTLLPSGEVNSEKYSIIKVHNHTSLSFGATQVSIDDLDGLK